MKTDRNFWDWISGNYVQGERFWYGKRLIIGFVIFLLIPMLIYMFVKWDPIIGFDEDGEPKQLGLWVIIGLYWVGAYFAYKRDEARRRLNRLLDKLLNKDEEEFNNFFEIAKRRRKGIKEDDYYWEEGENRLKWFDIP